MEKQDHLCTFYIVRHGQTEWNVKKLTQGHKDSPLTEQGISQAKELGKKLLKVKFDRAFSSDLLRAKRTAEIIALEHKLEVQTTELLREKSWGKLEGTDFETFTRTYNALVGAEKVQAEKELELEPDEEVVQRLITFLRETAVLYPSQSILIVTHGSIISRFLNHLGLWEKERPPDAISNGALAVIESDGVEFFIKDTQGIKI
jgi:broad specificity phosphatase PhoE